MDNFSEEGSLSRMLNDPLLQEQFASIFYCSHPKINAMDQLEEIRLLLKNSQERCQELFREIKDNANDTGLIYESIFRDIVHSMTAVGSLAPFIESLFTHSFDYLLSKQKNTYITNHHRWSRANKLDWDCHFFFNQSGSVNRDFSKGVIQLLEALGIREKFPQKLGKVLSALFAYRNEMFHGGYEWFEDDREKFWKRAEREWNIEGDKWFQRVTKSGNTWMIYMSDAFIDTCLEIVKLSLTAFNEVFAET